MTAPLSHASEAEWGGYPRHAPSLGRLRQLALAAASPWQRPADTPNPTFTGYQPLLIFGENTHSTTPSWLTSRFYCLLFEYLGEQYTLHQSLLAN